MPLSLPPTTNRHPHQVRRPRSPRLAANADPRAPRAGPAGPDPSSQGVAGHGRREPADHAGEERAAEAEDHGGAVEGSAGAVE